MEFGRRHQGRGKGGLTGWPTRILLVVLVAVVYAQVYKFPFINLDDDRYVTANPEVQAPLTWHSVAWAFTTNAVSNWHPLTWLSHLIDFRIFGLNAGGHHAVNVLFHAANTLLLFHVLARMTGAAGRSALVAALFAVHPLHVESVAWVAERKDVLSTFFGFLTLAAYARYVDRRTPLRYLTVVLTFALSLLSKPMLVTLPFVLLLLDYWPLDRVRKDQVWIRNWARLLVEKIPLLAMSLGTCVVTLMVQYGAGSVMDGEKYPVGIRVANALTAYVRYIGKLFYPHALAVFYPHPGNTLPVWLILAAGLLLAGATVIAILERRRHPYGLVGWLWFLGTLVPTIGLVQAGRQALADRYTYVPIVGVSILVVWGLANLAAKLRVPSYASAMAAGGVVLIATGLGAHQVGYWRDSTTLFEHALAVTSENSLVHYNLGVTLMHQGRYDAAIEHFRETFRIDPQFANAYDNLGSSLVAQGKAEDAIPYFEAALRVNPNHAAAHYNLATTLFTRGRLGEAATHFDRAVALDPSNQEGHYNYATTLYRLGKPDAAVAQFREAIRLRPDYADARINLGNALLKIGWLDDAVAEYREVARTAPNRLDVHVNLGHALAQQGHLQEAATEFAKALEIDPSHAATRANLRLVQEELVRRQSPAAANAKP
jgi:tetratricopeptide (TPR) repeat protein